MTEQKHILIAEDDPDDQSLIREAISETCPESLVDFVADGDELLELLEREPAPDLVLLDLNMPRMNGWQVLEAIHSGQVACRAPIVILTTSLNDPDVRRAYRLGAAGYVRKPTEYRNLVRKLWIICDYWFHMEIPPFGRGAGGG